MLKNLRNSKTLKHEIFAKLSARSLIFAKVSVRGEAGAADAGDSCLVILKYKMQKFKAALFHSDCS